MQGYGGKELARSYRTVRGNTITAAQEIPEDRLDFSPAPGTRTVRQLLTHIAFGDTFMQFQKEGRTSFEGVNFGAVVGPLMGEEQKPRTKAELIALLKDRGEATATWMESLSDAFLGEIFTQPPGATPATKTRFEMILGAKEHEMHHRAQLFLILRMLGQTPHLTRHMQERMAAAAQRS
jgi:uncharacterized damage-inducible protein DinB